MPIKKHNPEPLKIPRLPKLLKSKNGTGFSGQRPPAKLQLNKTYLVGVLNVTLDSFSDGNKFFKLAQAVPHALDMLEDGADIRVVREFLGHANLETTVSYTHVMRPAQLRTRSPLDG